MSERYIDLSGTRISLTAASLNELEDKLCSIPAKRPYQRYGPFMNGQAPAVTAAFFNGIEDFLASLDKTETRSDVTPIQQIGASKPLGWMDRQGNFTENPDYVPPAPLPGQGNMSSH